MLGEKKITILDTKASIVNDDLFNIVDSEVSTNKNKNCKISTIAPYVATYVATSLVAVKSTAVDYAILDGDGYTDIIFNNNSTALTVTLPLVANNLNRRLRFFNVSTISHTVSRNTSDTIYCNGLSLTTFQIPPNGGCIDLIDNSTQWFLQFQKDIAGLKLGCPLGGGFGILTVGANNAHGMRFIAPMNSVVTTLWVQLAGLTVGAKIVMGLYTDNAGVTGTLLAQSAEKTIVSSDFFQDTLFPLTIPVSLVVSQQYWIVFHSDTGLDLEKLTISTSGGRTKYKTLTYSATMPSSYGTWTGDAVGTSMAAF